MCGKDKGHKPEHFTKSSAMNGNASSHITPQHHYLKGKIKERRVGYAALSMLKVRFVHFHMLIQKNSYV